MVGGAPAPRGGWECLRSTAISVGASSRTLRPLSIGRRALAPSLPCPIPRPARARRPWSTSIRRCSADPRRIRRQTARRPESNAAPPGLRAGAVPLLVPCGLELHDVLRRRALLGLHDLELHALAFGQRLESLSLNRGVMYEAILAAVFGRDESKALGVVEPLHGTGDACHLSVAPGYAFERRDGRSTQKRHEARRRTAPGPRSVRWCPAHGTMPWPLRSFEASSGGRMMSMAARG